MAPDEPSGVVCAIAGCPQCGKNSPGRPGGIATMDDAAKRTAGIRTRVFRHRMEVCSR